MWMAMQRAWSRRLSAGERGPSAPQAWGGFEADRSLAAWHRGSARFVGGLVGVDGWMDQPADARAVFAAVERALSRLDALWNPDLASSDVARINAEAAVSPVTVASETFALLVRAMAMSRASGGAFDLTAGAVPATPDAPSAVGWHRVLLDARDRTVRFERPGLRLAPGDFARGAALDQIAALLQTAGVRHAVIRSHRLWRFVGDRRGEPWRVALGNSAEPASPQLALTLAEGALVTAGALAPAANPPDPTPSPGGTVEPLGRASVAAVRGLAVTAGDLAVAQSIATVLRTAGAADGLRLAASLPDCRAFVVDSDGQLQVNGPPAPPALAH